MKVSKSKREKIKRARRAVIFFVFSMIVIFILSYLYMKAAQPKFGHEISMSYYITLAAIFPPLLIALFITPNKVSVGKKEPKSVWWLLLFGGKLEGLFGFSVGEFFCLIAIANNRTGTAIVLGSIIGLLIMVWETFSRIVFGGLE